MRAQRAVVEALGKHSGSLLVTQGRLIDDYEMRRLHQTQILSLLPPSNILNATDTLPVPFLTFQTKKNLTAFPKAKFCYGIWERQSGKTPTWTICLTSSPFLRRQRGRPRKICVLNRVIYRGLLHSLWAFTPQTVTQIYFNYLYVKNNCFQCMNYNFHYSKTEESN